MVILDTNLLIDHLRQNLLIDSHLARLSHTYQESELAISIISIQELFAGQSTKMKKPLDQIAATISSLNIVEYSVSIAKQAGMIMRDYRLPFADAAIAATCLNYNIQLATLNTKDFVDIPNLKLLTL
jgi:predicted nucleic acid-binding protein